ncbi:MAG: DegV family protein [Streptococcaceae bacterium]|jgi:DegV family protein with EDD domain|nr:DegV family protein [Streptococcaceae bacterium]
MTYQIVTDSTTDLSDDYVAAHDVLMLGLTVTIDQKTYQTVGSARLTSDVLLAKMAEGAQPVSSQINVGQFSEVFKSLVQDGKDVLYLGFSSGLSGTFQSAEMAKQLVQEELPSAKIALVDTLAAASGEGYLIREAIKYRDQGATLEEVTAAIQDLIPRLRSWVMADDLYHLARGGRITKAAATVGTLVNIKPLIDVDPSGKLRQVGRIRGKKKALKTLIDKTLTAIDPAYPTILVGYSGEIDVAELVKADLLQSDLVEEVILTPLGPTIATHTGTGTIAIFSIGKSNRS